MTVRMNIESALRKVPLKQEEISTPEAANDGAFEPTSEAKSNVIYLKQDRVHQSGGTLEKQGGSIPVSEAANDDTFEVKSASNDLPAANDDVFASEAPIEEEPTSVVKESVVGKVSEIPLKTEDTVFYMGEPEDVAKRNLLIKLGIHLENQVDAQPVAPQENIPSVKLKDEASVRTESQRRPQEVVTHGQTENASLSGEVESGDLGVAKRTEEKQSAESGAERLIKEKYTGAVVYYKEPGQSLEETSFLLVRKFGIWSLPSNIINPDNNEKRETEELIKQQTGLSPKLEEEFDESRTDTVDPTLGSIETEEKYFLAKSETVEIPNTHESEEVKWFSLQELRKDDVEFDKQTIRLIGKAVEAIQKKIESEA